jgi:hypothetical protein
VFRVDRHGASGAKLTLNNLTVANGFARSEGAGGINNSGTLTVSNSTLSDNQSYNSGSIINYGTATLENTILANSPCVGTLTNGGYNLDSGTSCGFGTDKTSLSGG